MEIMHVVKRGLRHFFSGLIDERPFAILHHCAKSFAEFAYRIIRWFHNFNSLLIHKSPPVIDAGNGNSIRKLTDAMESQLHYLLAFLIDETPFFSCFYSSISVLKIPC